MINLCFIRDEIFPKEAIVARYHKIYGRPQAKPFYHELVMEMSTFGMLMEVL